MIVGMPGDKSIPVWKQWLHRPQNVWLRRALFQIHLWTGIGLGLYVVLISLSGSAIVFRNELYKYWGSGPKMVPVQSVRLTEDQMRANAHQRYPGFAISFYFEGRRPGQATEIWLEKGSSKKQRLFDPYTGDDLGRSVPIGISTVAWLSDLHTNLLGGPKGRVVNGVASIFVTLLCLTGAVLWWPGSASWRRSLMVNPKANWKRLNWELHSAIGFWTFALVFMWAFTGIYLVFPDPFQKAVNHFAPLDFYRILSYDAPAAPPLKAPNPVFVLVDDAPATPIAPPVRSDRPNTGRGPRRRFVPHYSRGDMVLRWVYYLHFGNFAGNKTKGVWVALGLLPAILFLTGAIMWWNRVLSREARRLKRKIEIPGFAAPAPQHSEP